MPHAEDEQSVPTIEAQLKPLPRSPLSEVAQRALAEAELRRRAAAESSPLPKEMNGRGGPEPIRYGDWEVKGLCSDF